MSTQAPNVQRRSTEPEQVQKANLSRRDFLKLAWGAAGLSVLIGGTGMALSFLSPRVGEGEFGGVITAGNVADFPMNSVTPFNTGRFYLVRAADGGFLALYRKCTHLGCAVPWDQARGEFVCPCHASAFTMDGTVINPPAPRPLDRFAVVIEAGVVKVNTAGAIMRDHSSTDDLVYA